MQFHLHKQMFPGIVAFFLLLLSGGMLQAQSQRLVSGVVTDADGQAIVGATVRLQGTGSGTVTDLDGTFSLQVPEAEAVLVISYIGYRTEEIAVGNRSSLDIQLTEDRTNLDEVVVIGYGTTTRRDVTGSISSVTSEEIERLPVPGIESALQGRAAGVVVIQDSGAPGGSVSVRIRGLGSLGDNEPLYVIDGVQTKDGLNLLNPNDIQSIEILKDASAAAIYGVRGANGVVLITTKKGQYNARPTVSLSTYYGIQEPTGLVEALNGSEWALLQREALTNGGMDLNPDFDTDEEIAAAGEGTDWLDEVFRPAPMQSYQLGVSGGSASTRYYFSGNYFDQEGIVRNSFFERASLRANVETEVGDRLQMGTNLTLSRSNRNFISSDDDADEVLQNALGTPPVIPVFDEDGSYAGPPEPQEFYGRQQNAVGQAERRDDLSTNTRILGNFYAAYEPIRGLVLKSDFQFDYINNDNDFFRVDFNEGNRTGPGNLLRRSINQTNYYSWENTLTYTAELGRNHELTVLGGVTAQEFEIDFVSAGRDQFLSQVEENRYLNGGTLNPSAGGGANDWSLFSYLGRVNYSFLNRYLLTASFRADGSSRFTEENRWGYFPSFSAGWRVSEESFLADSPVFSDLKIRGGWGQLGNQDIGFYPTLTLYGLRGDAFYGFGGGQEAASAGYAVVTRGNPDIVWETSNQSNIGFDASLFDYRLRFTVDYYNRTTEDILLRTPVPATGGVAPAPFVNAATVTNDGFEFLIGYQGGKPEGFTYDVSVNLTTINNEVTSLGTDDPEFGIRSSGFTRTEVGRQIGFFFGFEADGIFQSEEEIAALDAIDGDPSTPYQNAATAPGDVRFVDTNGDGVVNADDRTAIGSPFPDFTYGFNADLGYGNFDLSIFLQGVTGNDIYNQGRSFFEPSSLVDRNGYATLLDRWTPTNTDTEMPRLVAGDPNNNSRFSSRFIEDGSFLRLRNVQLGYRLPAGVLDRLGLASLRLYVSAQNLFTITDYQGFDPEIGRRRGNDQSYGIDTSVYPQARVFLFGLNLSL